MRRVVHKFEAVTTSRVFKQIGVGIESGAWIESTVWVSQYYIFPTSHSGLYSRIIIFFKSLESVSTQLGSAISLILEPS